MKTVTMMMPQTTLNCKRLLPTNTSFLASKPKTPTKKSLDNNASLCSGKSNTMRKKLKSRRKLKKTLMLMKMDQIVLRHWRRCKEELIA